MSQSRPVCQVTYFLGPSLYFELTQMTTYGSFLTTSVMRRSTGGQGKGAIQRYSVCRGEGIRPIFGSFNVNLMFEFFRGSRGWDTPFPRSFSARECIASNRQTDRVFDVHILPHVAVLSYSFFGLVFMVTEPATSYNGRVRNRQTVCVIKVYIQVFHSLHWLLKDFYLELQETSVTK